MKTRQRSLLLWLCLCLIWTPFSRAIIPPGAYSGSVHDSSPTKAPSDSSSKRSKRPAPLAFHRPDNNNNNHHDKKSWSSMLTVDPSKILSHLIKRGGLVLPKDAAKQMDVLRKCMHVERAELNVLSKDLILYNLTIGLDHRLPALRVSRAQVSWDSYLRPTLEVQVEDVHVLVEFTNLLLTENNWNEIQAAGFPPSISMDQQKTPTAPATAVDHSEDNAFLRFSKIELQGSCTVQVTSRPLSNKEIGTTTLDLRQLRGLSRQIQALSDDHLQRTGRYGCSPEEVGRTIQQYFDQKIREFVKARVEELAHDPKASLKQAEDLVGRARESVMGYVQQAGQAKSNELQQTATERLKNWGVPNPSATLTAIKERALYGVEKLNITAVRDHVNREAASVLESLQEMRDSLKNLDQREDETEFVFADW